ncbi:hypothetical protein [Lentibacter algarum]|uniref:hypothetical protein n=1 Tax=Lentibacter algarum TaxID=576131 RepID=UPI003AF8F512
MKDGSSGGLLTFIFAAPVVLICCGGKAVLIGTALFGTAGFMTGANMLTIALVATLGGDCCFGHAISHADEQMKTKI